MTIWIVIFVDQQLLILQLLNFEIRLTNVIIYIDGHQDAEI